MTRPDGEGLTDEARYDQGMAVRRAVLSDAHVDRAIGNTTELTADWQDFITRVAWGEVWGDPTLSWKTRAMLTLAMMTALHREEEFVPVEQVYRCESVLTTWLGA